MTLKYHHYSLPIINYKNLGSRTQLINWLLCKHVALSSDPQHPHKSQVWWHMPIISMLGRASQSDPWRFLVNRSNWISELQDQWETVSGNKEGLERWLSCKRRWFSCRGREFSSQYPCQEDHSCMRCQFQGSEVLLWPPPFVCSAYTKRHSDIHMDA